jgi:hypothetical protein
MAENIITNANDVELVMETGDTTRGTPSEMGRVLVDEFTITREEDDSLESGVGHRLPAGISNGDIEHSFSFTIMGQDVEVFEMVATSDGRSRIFSFTARKVDDEGTIEWEYALDTCKATTEELSGSSGDPMEYSVEGIAVSVDKASASAWNN